MLVADIIAWVIFGAVGFVAFVYGRKMGQIKTALLGVLLMCYPYFVSDTWLLYAFGVALTAALFIFRE